MVEVWDTSKIWEGLWRNGNKGQLNGETSRDERGETTWTVLGETEDGVGGKSKEVGCGRD